MYVKLSLFAEPYEQNVTHEVFDGSSQNEVTTASVDNGKKVM